MRLGSSTAPVDKVRVNAFTIPTDYPESDGTIEWNSTTMVLVEVSAGGKTGLGYTYSHPTAAELIEHTLAKSVFGKDAFDIPAIWSEMVRQVRNIGLQGLAATAISAVDNALWDLKARLLELPLVNLLGAAHDSVLAYGSGGFTSYSIEQLQKQLSGWAEQGLERVKMKVGRDLHADSERVRAARKAIGSSVELYVDANGAYTRKQALAFAEEYAKSGVTWFEEPVSSDDLTGLAAVRHQIDADVAAGEYGYDLTYFERMCAATSVDCLQVDITRCGGITEWMRAAAVAAAHHLDVSAHCAPNLHAHAAAATPNLRHVEYFHDHVRVEELLFEGVLAPRDGSLRPDTGSAGHGLRLRRDQAQQYRTA